GAIEFAKIEIEDDPNLGTYQGCHTLRWYIEVGRGEEKKERGSAGLWKDAADLEDFKRRYRKEVWHAPKLTAGTNVRAFIGIDGGSTSTKGVLLDMDKKVIGKAYQLSRGNPIEDMVDILGQLQQYVADAGCTL